MLSTTLKANGSALAMKDAMPCTAIVADVGVNRFNLIYMCKVRVYDTRWGSSGARVTKVVVVSTALKLST